MAIFIKNMEMPTWCGDCRFAATVGTDKMLCSLTGKMFDSWTVGWGSKDNHGEDGQRPYIRHEDCPIEPA